MPNRQKGAVHWYVAAGIGFVIAAGIITFFNIGAAPGPVTLTKFSGSVTTPAPFPTYVDGDLAVTYKVTTQEVTVPYGGGVDFPGSATSPEAVEDALITFTLANGDATFADGSTTRSVTTDADGLANVTLKPAADGDDTLSFSIKITTGSWWWKKTHTIPDPATFVFEVEAP